MSSPSRKLSTSYHKMTFSLRQKSLRKRHSLFLATTQLKVPLVGVTKKKKFQLFQKKCYTAFGSPNNMTLCYLPLLWGNSVLTEVVNKLISISFLGRISWACSNHREAHSGMQVWSSSLPECLGVICYISQLLLLPYLGLLLLSLLRVNPERRGLLFSLRSIIERLRRVADGLLHCF